MSLLNQAYQTLKNPSELRDYVLNLRGYGPDKAKGSSEAKMSAVSMDLAEAWFEVQDLLTEDLGLARERLKAFEAKLATAVDEAEKVLVSLESDYDRNGSSLEKLAQAVRTQSYLKSLQKDVERIKKNAYPN